MTQAAKGELVEKLEAARRGDRAAFDRLAAAYRPEIVAYCFRFLGRREDAEDAAQEVFSHAWQHLSGFRMDSSFRTWIWEIARNRCLNLLRARKSLLNQKTHSLDTVNSLARQETLDVCDSRPGPELSALSAANVEAMRAEIRAVAAEKNWVASDWELLLLRIEKEIPYADFAKRHGRDEAYWRNRWRDKIKPVLERVRERIESNAP